MPTTLPGISVTKAGELLATQDRIIKSFPEVASSTGRRAAPTRPPTRRPWRCSRRCHRPEAKGGEAPRRHPRQPQGGDGQGAAVPRRVETPERSDPRPHRHALDRHPYAGRIKVLGTDLKQMEGVARQVEAVVRAVPGTSSAYAERVIGGYFLDITPTGRLGRYGPDGRRRAGRHRDGARRAAVTNTVEGRERYTVNVRYPRAFRSDPRAIADEVQVPCRRRHVAPAREVAKVEMTRGADLDPHRERQLAVYIFVDIATRPRRLRGRARQGRGRRGTLPQGTTLQWSGQYEYLERAEARLRIVVPLTLLVVLPAPLPELPAADRDAHRDAVAAVRLGRRGVVLLWWMGFNMSGSPSRWDSSRSPASPPRRG